MELVVVFPVAVVVILLCIQTGMWFLARAAATDAAAEGARAAAILGGTPAAGTAQAQTSLAQVAGPLISRANVSAIEAAGRIRVTVTGRAEAILPGLGLAVTASVSRPVEAFQP